MNGDPMHSRLAGLAPPEPAERLRARALDAAGRAWGDRPDVWRRLWESRPARLAWAATVAALVASHLWLAAAAPRAEKAPTSATLAHAAAAGPEEATDVLEVRIAPIAWVGEGLSRSSTAHPRRSSDRKKETS